MLRDTSTRPGWDRTGNPPTARRQLYLLSRLFPLRAIASVVASKKKAGYTVCRLIVLLQCFFPVGAEAAVLATADYRRLPQVGRSDRLRCVCGLGLCYYSASSPVRAKVTVLATADYRRLPPVWAGATGYAVCGLGLCYYSASSPARAKVTVLATADYRRLPPFGQERPATPCVDWASAITAPLPPLGRK